MDFLNLPENLQQLCKDEQEEYLNAVPFPNIVTDNFFDEGVYKLR